MRSWLNHLKQARQLNNWIRLLTRFQYQMHEEDKAHQLNSFLNTVMNAELREIVIHDEKDRAESPKAMHASVSAADGSKKGSGKHSALSASSDEHARRSPSHLEKEHDQIVYEFETE